MKFLPFALLIAGKRHTEELKQSLAFLVRPRCRDYVDLHASDPFHLVVVDFREYQLFPYAEAVVPAPVEGFRRQATEVAEARQSRVDQPVEELVHPLAPERHHYANRHALA